ncbi:unnamed protein product [Caenorhabditis brenneri]
MLRKEYRNIKTELLFCDRSQVDLNYDFSDGSMSLESLKHIQYSTISIEHKVSEKQNIEKTRIGGYLIPVTKKIDEKGELTLEFHLLITDDEIRSVLNMCNATNKFFIYSTPTPGFRHQFVFENDSIDVMNAYWFNINNLFNMNCRVCHIWGSKLTNVEMNQFLKMWKTGAFSKMHFVDVDMEDIDLEVLLADLDAVEVPEGTQRKFINEDNEEETIAYGFDIQCQDGRIATIVHDGGIIPYKAFFMIVW